MPAVLIVVPFEVHDVNAKGVNEFEMVFGFHGNVLPGCCISFKLSRSIAGIH